MRYSKTKAMTLTAVTAALLCIAGPLSIAIGPIPLSLATFAVYMAGAVLGARKGTAAVGLYLVIGLIGVPVFLLITWKDTGASSAVPSWIALT